jgi:hypothetical protein
MQFMLIHFLCRILIDEQEVMSDPESKAINFIQSGCQKAQEGKDEVR